MSLVSLTFTEWRRLDRADVVNIAAWAATEVGGRIDRIDSVEHLGSTFHRVLIERDGRLFSLIPGGQITVGFDLDEWRPAPELSQCYQESLTQGFDFEPDLRGYLARFLSPRRAVTVPTVLMAVEAEMLIAPPREMPEHLALRGLRLPHPDEWEHACGAGATTLFRWGDSCPVDRIPYGDETGPHRPLNAFGLRIAHEVYDNEITSDPDTVKGGDGGEAVCGGYGIVQAWVPLATAYRNLELAELVHESEGDGMYEEFTARPVIDLSRPTLGAAPRQEEMP